ncbi:MAG: VOC family protein [Candidatus Eisenbacteria bacterium]
MDRLTYVILVTSDMERMKRFYRDQLGLKVRLDRPRWVEFETAGATLALNPVTPVRPRGIEVVLDVPDVLERKQELEARGVQFSTDVMRISTGAVALFEDPEGALVTLYTPDDRYEPAEDGPALSMAIVNCHDLHAAKAFWRNVVGLHTTTESGWWVEFDTGTAHLALAPRAQLGAGEHHHAKPMALAIESDDLNEWSDRLHAQGVEFVTTPHDTPFGLMADVRDPDGNVLVLHEPAVGEPLEEELEEVFAGESPSRETMRKPGTTKARAISKVAIRPRYKSIAGTERKKPSATTRAVVKERGEGPNGTGRMPKKTGDERKAKSKPAQGRLKKSTREAAVAQKRASATRARGKPLKRAVASRAKKAARPARRTRVRATSGRR